LPESWLPILVRLPALTVPPAETVAEPVAVSPSKTLLLVNSDPAPLTSNDPLEPAALAMEVLVPELELTTPPLVIASEPVPDCPTVNEPLSTHFEPLPLTLAAPSEVAVAPMTAAPPALVVILPPLMTDSVPVPASPTRINPPALNVALLL